MLDDIYEYLAMMKALSRNMNQCLGCGVDLRSGRAFNVNQGTEVVQLAGDLKVSTVFTITKNSPSETWLVLKCVYKCLTIQAPMFL